MVGGARTVSLLTFLSRILGMVRDVVIAYVFGATKAMDAFVIAFVVPNMFRHLFGEGALTSAFLPAFVGRLEKEGRLRANDLFNAVLFWLVKVLTVLTLAGMLIAFVVPLVLPGEDLALIMKMLRVTMPYLLLICTAAIMGAALNGVGHFAMPAAAPAVLNVVFILAALIAHRVQSDVTKVTILAWAVLVGGVLQLLMQVPPLYSNALGFDLSHRRDEGLKDVLRMFLPAVLGLAVVQINELLDNVIAKVCVPDDGAVSALYYANRLNQLPLAIIGISIATAALPAFSAAAARNDEAGLRASIGHALRLCLFVSIPATFGLMALSREITDVLFYQGKFTREALERTQMVVRMYAMGIPFFAANVILTRACYAQQDARTPVRVSLMTVGLNLVLNLTLVWFLKEAGIALATSITGVFNFLLLLTLLKRRVAGLDEKDVLGVTVKSAVLSLAMVASCLALYHLVMRPVIDGFGKWQMVVKLLVPITVGVAIYFGGALLLRIEEAKQIFKRGSA